MSGFHDLGNRTQRESARFTLQRALSREELSRGKNTDALADWAREYGEAALECIETLSQRLGVPWGV